MKSTFRVLFFLKRDKVKRTVICQSWHVLPLTGKLAQFNTKLEVNPKTGLPKPER